MSEFSYNMEDVLRLENIDYNPGKQIRVKCPFCDKKKIAKDMSINLATEQYNCYSCGVSGRSSTNFYAQLHGLTSKEAYKEIMSQLGLFTDHYNDFPKKPQRETKEIKKEYPEDLPIANDDILDKTYRALLEELTLFQRDKSDLLKRGFSEMELVMTNYKSYPTGDPNGIVQEYFDIPKRLLAKGCVLEGVPGFHKTKNKSVHTLVWKKSGILVPQVSYENKLIGLQLRKHNEELDEEENKYSWISSTGKNQGCAAVARTHYSCDFIWDKDTHSYSPIIKDGIINFTEGGMKADLVHAITGKPVISRPGCGILNGLLDDLIRLKEEKGVHTFCCLYDMDYISNKNVQKDIEKLKNIVASAGLKYLRPVWNTEVNGKDVLKGIDDYYAYYMRGIIPG